MLQLEILLKEQVYEILVIDVLVDISTEEGKIPGA